MRFVFALEIAVMTYKGRYLSEATIILAWLYLIWDKLSEQVSLINPSSLSCSPDVWSKMLSWSFMLSRSLVCRDDIYKDGIWVRWLLKWCPFFDYNRMRFWANRCCPLFISKHCLIVLVELYIKMLSYTFFYVNHMFLLAPSSPYHTSFQILLFRSQFYAIPSCWWWLVQGRYLNKVALEWLVLAWLHPKLRLNIWANLNIPAMQCCESFSLPFVLCSLG